MTGAREGALESGSQPISVSQAVGLAAAAADAMPTLLVNGEVTGFRGPNARSGHCYFQVKDDSSAMDVIVWRGSYAKSGVRLRDGLQLEMQGRFNVYRGSGRLSFVASRISVAGEGLLRQQVAQLARKLEAEGLMAPERKRPIPRFCQRVAVVTSLSGSVIDDVKRTLARRNPLVQVQVAGCMVQGPGAPESIIRALGVAAAARPDAILLVRGGGSFEDLMTFNDEALARAVAACPVPVITGIGHEPDTSICDMVGDRRTSTPTAAAESVAPGIDEVELQISERAKRLVRSMSSTLALSGQALDGLGALASRSLAARLAQLRSGVEALGSRRCLSDPAATLRDRELQLVQTEQRLHDAVPRGLAIDAERTHRLADRLRVGGEGLLSPFDHQTLRLAATLEALSPLKVLTRGYAIARDGEGHVLSDAESVGVGDELRLLLAHGSVGTVVTNVSPEAAGQDAPRKE